MFRTSLLRPAANAASAVRLSVLSAVVRRPLTQAVAKSVVGPAPRASAFAATRFYSSEAESGEKKTMVEGRIMSLLAGFDKINDPNNIKPTAHFANDLGLDSLDTVEVVMAIEEEFSIEIPDKEADKIHSVEQAVEYITSQPDTI